MKIIINATAAKTSGALTVLRDCIAFLEKNCLANYEYHLFTVVDEFDKLMNIHVHKMKVQSWIPRIQWDNGGLQKWCKRNNLEPDAIISLQNTSTKFRNKTGMMIVQVVYYHHLVPLYKWNGMMSHDLKNLMYRYFYPFFVNRNNKTSHYVVQLPYVKELFCKRFKNITPNRVTIVRPNKPKINYENINEKINIKDENKFIYFYPATMMKYKNHEILIRALVKIKKENPDILKKIVIIFTLDKLPKYLKNFIKSNELNSSIQLIGQISYDEMMSYYKSVNALLFPSKIESFGLPLLEASCFGLPIIAADLPYAREVVENYSNKYFLNQDNVSTWAKAISEYKNYKKIVPENSNIYENTWENIFELTNKLIHEQNK